jgi:hypothetical protein
MHFTRVDVLDHIEQCQVANWREDPLLRIGLAV